MIGSSIPVAAGAALAFKLKRTNGVAIAYIGEGGTSTGDFHEALNFAGVQRLPLIVVVENNFFAYSTPVSKQMAVENVAERAAGYGMPGHTCSGNDLLSVRQLACQAVQRARDWLGPTLIECKTYRWHGHSEHDDAVVSRERGIPRVEEPRPDPRYELYLREREVLTDEIAEHHRADAAGGGRSRAFAEKSPYPEPHEALDNLYSEGEP